MDCPGYGTGAAVPPPQHSMQHSMQHSNWIHRQEPSAHLPAGGSGGLPDGVEGTLREVHLEASPQLQCVRQVELRKKHFYFKFKIKKVFFEKLYPRKLPLLLIRYRLHAGAGGHSHKRQRSSCGRVAPSQRKQQHRGRARKWWWARWHLKATGGDWCGSSEQGLGLRQTARGAEVATTLAA